MTFFGNRTILLRHFFARKIEKSNPGWVVASLEKSNPGWVVARVGLLRGHWQVGFDPGWALVGSSAE